MALIDQVRLRFTSAQIVQLTNPDDENATAEDSTKLQDACDDAEAEFEDRVGQTYTETIRSHRALAVLMVKLKLIEYGASADETAEALRGRIDKLVDSTANVRARDRVAPQTNSQLTPSDEVVGTETRRPAFDDNFFNEIIPEVQETEEPDLD